MGRGGGLAFPTGFALSQLDVVASLVGPDMSLIQVSKQEVRDGVSQTLSRHPLKLGIKQAFMQEMVEMLKARGATFHGIDMSTGQTQAECEALCTLNSSCKGYEYGQNWGGILCKLIYPGVIPSCPSGFSLNAVGDGGTSISGTHHSTGGFCYKKN